MAKDEFTFQGTAKLDRIDRFTSKGNKEILTLVFRFEGTYPQIVPIKVFGRLADRASEWHPGDILEVQGRLGGRDWNGKVYGDNVATSIEVVSAGRAPEAKGAVPDKLDDDEGSVPF